MNGGPGGGVPSAPSEEPEVCGELAGEAGVVEHQGSQPEQRLITPQRPGQPCEPCVDSVVQR